jgi:hypothetical protein
MLLGSGRCLAAAPPLAPLLVQITHYHLLLDLSLSMIMGIGVHLLIFNLYFDALVHSSNVLKSSEVI